MKRFRYVLKRGGIFVGSFVFLAGIYFVTGMPHSSRVDLESAIVYLSLSALSCLFQAFCAAWLED